MMRLHHPVVYCASVQTTSMKISRSGRLISLIRAILSHITERVCRLDGHRTVLRAGRPVWLTPPDFLNWTLGEFFDSQQNSRKILRYRDQHAG